MRIVLTILFLCSVAGLPVASAQQSSKHRPKPSQKLDWSAATTRWTTGGVAFSTNFDGMTWHPTKKLPGDVRDHWSEVIRGGKRVAVIMQDGHTLFSPGEDPAEITNFMLRLIELTVDSQRQATDHQQKELAEALTGWRRNGDIARACLTIINKSILPKGKRVPRS